MTKTNKSNKPKVINKDEVSSKILVHEKQTLHSNPDEMLPNTTSSPVQLTGDDPNQTEGCIEVACGAVCSECLSDHEYDHSNDDVTGDSCDDNHHPNNNCSGCNSCSDDGDTHYSNVEPAENSLHNESDSADLTGLTDLTDLRTFDLAPDVFMWIYTISKLVYE